MKQSVLILCIAVMGAYAGSIVHTAYFDRGDLLFTRVGEYDVVELRGYPALVAPGMPRVPRVVEALSIPAGAQPVSVEVVAADWVEVPGEYVVAPAQPDVPLPVPGQVHAVPDYGPDARVYGVDALYPFEVVKVSGSGTMNGYRIAHVEMYPVRYNPVSGRVMFARSITYRVEYQGYVTSGVIATERQQKVFGQTVRSIVENPQDVGMHAPRIGQRVREQRLPPGYFEYVVITEVPMDTVFERLAAMKTAKGVPATVVLVSWINANYSGVNLPERIRNFIIDAQATWGSYYFLLGGSGDPGTSGQNIVPTRRSWYTSAGGGNTDSLPADLYYADLDGNWNFDGDNTYGELS
ncbi:hypothetical protein JXB22_08870, partial [candidate division WOR-3 bacterium]|nr:hypothetical protein [candidate division WOR-3 bacterium]